MCVFCYKQKTAHEMRISDWSSDVGSSDLGDRQHDRQPHHHRGDRALADIFVGFLDEIEAHHPDHGDDRQRRQDRERDQRGSGRVPRLDRPGRPKERDDISRHRRIKAPQIAPPGLRVLVHVKPPFESGKEALQTSMLYVKAALHARKTRSRWPHLRLTFGGMLKRSEEHTSELQSLMRLSYAVF